MIKHILKKILGLIPTILIVITITFFILRLTPGDPAEIYLGEYATEETTAALREKLGLNEHPFIQYIKYMSSFLRGDFGRSIKTGEPILDQIIRVFPHTLRVAILALIIASLFGIPIGVLAALNRNKFLDRSTMLLTLIGVSTPIFVSGFLLLLLFSFRLSLLPMIGVGREGDTKSILMHLVLPSLTLGLSTGAIIARITRSKMLDVLSEDYIKTARLKGLRERIVILRHAFMNALVGILSVIGLQFSMLLGGTVVTESVFTRQGMGKLLVDGILARDYPQVQGVVAVYITVVILINLIMDLLYGVIDPRMHKS